MTHPSLEAPAMAPLWEAVQDRLERRGLDRRGVLAVPDLDATARLTVKSLLDRTTTPRRIDLAEVEAALVALGVGPDLPAALAALGFEVSDDRARRRDARRQGQTARQATRRAAAAWPEPWADEWVDGAIRAGVVAGMDPEAAERLVADTRRVLDAIDARGDNSDSSPRHAGGSDSSEGGGEPISRVDLAAQVLGDAHALDPGRRLEASVSRALAMRAPMPEDTRPWEAAGVHLDLTSGPVLTWRLPVQGALAPLVEAATAAGLPVHLSRMALLDHPPRFAPETNVLVTENPRVVEAAAQLGVDHPVVSAGGSPSAAVQLLVRLLVESGATVRYHGDFDSAGLALCARMHAVGATPWRMTAADYRAALDDAEAQGIDLPVDPHPPGATPWDPQLREAFDHDRRIVHEERLLPHLLRHLS